MLKKLEMKKEKFQTDFENQCGEKWEQISVW